MPIKITGTLTTTDPSDVYPTHDAELGKGGYRSVQTLTDLSSIPTERRTVGMWVKVIDNDTLYEWDGSNFVEIPVGPPGPMGLPGLDGQDGATGFTGSQGQIGFTGSQGVPGIMGLPGLDGQDGATGFTGSQGQIGFTGSQGVPGIMGLPGLDGQDGATGFTGSQGQIGFTGSQGVPGIMGLPGATGFTGSQGVIGFTGSQGAGFTGSQGVIGFTGSQGVIGFTGSQGVPGIMGLPGLDGQDGATGFTGSQGFAGSIGFTGSQGVPGIMGLPGATGFTGSQGQIGFTGSQGAGFTGSQGQIGFTGSRGVVGFTGSQGVPGIMGLPGTTGFTGSQGQIGFTGSQGVIGFTGSQGVIGFTGSRGATGFTGSQGVPGIMGLPGLDGTTGFTGSQGTQGAIGYTGSQGVGFTGSRGATGFTGSQGQIGFTGSQGVPGIMGLPGATGFTGSQGTQGVIGYTGSQGTTGFTGSQGIQGNVGFTGSRGATGFTGSQGIQGNVGFTGSQGIIGFTGSQGVPGIMGLPGATGFTGSQGTQGNVGFTGSRGVTGFTGSQGTQGNVGFTGSQGVGFTGSQGIQGNVGFTGSQGNVGFTGSRGVTGFTGSQGIQGNVGFTGSQGVIGFTGSQGVPGIMGLPGATGFTGSQGTQGVIGYTGSQGVGFTGSQGIQGNVGFTGSRGVTGFTGSQGTQGNAGFTGSQGIQGNVGFTGSQGIQGVVGYTGSQGIQGNVGFTGSRGATGFTGSQGIQGNVGFTGSQGVGFTGSQGIQGNVGFTGSQGTQGNVGFTGSQGIQGNVGFTGSRGVTGFTGSKGEPGAMGLPGVGFTGSQGTQGNVGFTGSRGATGFTGSQGTQGTQGNVGFTGSQGIQGIIGFTGSQGIQGNVGFTGSRGLTGATGFTGSQGIQGNVGFTGSQGIQGNIGFTGSQGAVGFTGSGGISLESGTNVDNYLITAKGTTEARGEANLTFNGTTLSLTGSFTTSGTITSTVAQGSNVLQWSNNAGIQRITTEGGVGMWGDSSVVIHSGDSFAAILTGLGIAAGTTTETLTLSSDVEVNVIPGQQSGYTTAYRWRFLNNGTLLPKYIGAAATPTYSFEDDSNTGIYRSASDVLAFSAGGSLSGSFNSSGMLSTTSIALGDDTTRGPIMTFGTITGGSGYTDGVYTGVALTGGSGSSATADITVSGGAVTVVTLVREGARYIAGDSLSASTANIGGTGSGFAVDVATVRQAAVNVYTTLTGISPRIRLMNSSGSLSAGTELGSLLFASNDATAGARGDKARIIGVAEGASGGGGIEFWTASNGAEPTLSFAIRGNNDIRLYNSAGTFYHAFSNAPTANRTLTLPDANVTLVSGTMVPDSRTVWGQALSGNVTGNLTSVGNITGTAGITLEATGSNSLTFRTNATNWTTLGSDGILNHTGATYPVFRVTRTTALTTNSIGVSQFKLTSSGEMGDGFGPSVVLAAEDATSGEQVAGQISTYRTGADNSYSMRFITVNGGSNVNALTLAPAGAATFVGAVTVSTGGISVTGNSTITGTLSGITTLTATTFSGSGASLTSLPAGQLSGTIPSSVLGNSSLSIGTTSIQLNRSSSPQSLSGVSIDGNAGTATTLAASKNIWGQAFDGSSNIGGRLEMRGNTGATDTLQGYSQGIGWNATVGLLNNLTYVSGNVASASSYTYIGAANSAGSTTRAGSLLATYANINKLVWLVAPTSTGAGATPASLTEVFSVDSSGGIYAASVISANGDATIGTTGGSTRNFIIQSAAGNDRSIYWRTGSSPRWRIFVTNQAESGSDAGSNLYWQAFNDAGTLIDNWMTVTRASGGTVTIARPISVSGDIIPTTDNTGNVGTTANTWANGQFTNLTIDSVLSVRAAIDLADSDILRFGSSDDWEFFHNGTDNYIDLNVGDMIIRDNTTNRFSFARTTGDLVTFGNITAYGSPSDERFKYNIKPINNALDTVLKLEGVTFNWKKDTPSHKLTRLDSDIGFIAQQVQEILPELVRADETGYFGLRERAIIPLLVEAIKELNDKIERNK